MTEATCKQKHADYKTDKETKATKLAACESGDPGATCRSENAPPTAVTCCSKADGSEKLAAAAVKFSVTKVTYGRDVDTTTNEEKWTYKSSVATTTTWDHDTGVAMLNTGAAAKTAYATKAGTTFPV